MPHHDHADTVIVLDFETTGFSPNYGDRTIEVGAVLVENGKITDQFQQLMNPGFRISSFIAEYTGITNQMLRSAPSCEIAMAEFADFLGRHNLVAHNASFDHRFLNSELEKINREHTGQVACSMLVSRRLYQNAPNHKLETLVEYKNLATDRVFHRALADAEKTTHLWLTMLEDIQNEYQIESIPFSLMKQLAKTPKKSVARFLQRWQ